MAILNMNNDNDDNAAAADDAMCELIMAMLDLNNDNDDNAAAADDAMCELHHGHVRFERLVETQGFGVHLVVDFVLLEDERDAFFTRARAVGFHLVKRVAAKGDEGVFLGRDDLFGRGPKPRVAVAVWEHFERAAAHVVRHRRVQHAHLVRDERVTRINTNRGV
eukprot:CAMPEP_0179624406 /NCGR_PEP_ID=MMETSP0932-20121108/2753_1 /TAXON_ID=548131 ORGANISM="Ostreococcus mediterraneus, Strain clade-D-RCC2596" /NCGR_SAMPLE_ID=MMETSP0932 /ASSEMBLY_ACC=CAM_ASM_000582 /LENGTH=163 /DNA_ID=CAMNT_0021493609 /DNA_START=10 /DNA_END=502 /DNA_ORIENTATION=+